MAKTSEPFQKAGWVPGQFSAPIGPLALPRCSHCNKWMRPEKTKKADWPGTVAIGSKGLCSSHYIASLRGSLKNTLDRHDWAFQSSSRDFQLTPNTPEELEAARRVVPEDLWDMLDLRDAV